ncbi:MAG: hypothetical protein C4567_03570 [Deltaproteobacteria bacterium]|nr:MAG: hypothetical protein C4567_03570 [Deltaproteobacteria bacterium]
MPLVRNGREVPDGPLRDGRPRLRKSPLLVEGNRLRLLLLPGRKKTAAAANRKDRIKAVRVVVAAAAPNPEAAAGIGISPLPGADAEFAPGLAGPEKTMTTEPFAKFIFNEFRPLQKSGFSPPLPGGLIITHKFIFYRYVKYFPSPPVPDHYPQIKGAIG